MDLSGYKSQMQKNFDYLLQSFNSMQLGRASAGLLDSININASYGQVKMSAIGHVSVMDPHTLKVECWDKSELKNVEKAIYDSELWLSPKNEWEYILIKIPALTQERRQELAKKCKSLWEDTKAHMRRVRQDAMKETKSLLDEKTISEDEHKSNEQSVEDLVKEYNTKIDSAVKAKWEEIMSV